MKSFDLVAACVADMEEVGYSVPAIEADTSDCDWSYTIGLHRTFDHPELILIGLDAPLAGAVLEYLCQQIVDGVEFAPSSATGFGPLRLRFRTVGDIFRSHGEWFGLGRELLARFGEAWPPTLQVLWADRDGDYPIRPGDPSWMLRQPLLAEI
ncbi:MAG: DUF4262 domain-containing protein [Acidimicrobiales bacterium]|jgi:hypothetical protein